MRDPIEHVVTSVALIMALLSVEDDEDDEYEEDEDDWEDDYSYDSQGTHQ